jgi:amidase
MPAATSSVVGVFPTRGLVSIAGIAPLDWLLDNTGPIARDVTDTAIALGVLAGTGADTVDPLDAKTAERPPDAQAGPYLSYLRADALKGKRFGVPKFVMDGAGVPFQGVPASATPEVAARMRHDAELPLRPETREAFIKAVAELRAAGATVVFDDSILPESFAETASHVCTLPYVREGTVNFLRTFGPAEYHSPEEYERAVGRPLPSTIIGGPPKGTEHGDPPGALVTQRVLAGDPQAETEYLGPRRQILAAYKEVLERLHLDGLVYPAIQMPPPDETMPQNGHLSDGPHSDTSWVNMIGVPAVVVPGGFYRSGLPFGLEISGKPWRDGDLLGYAFAYEQATKHRRRPVLVEKGLLVDAP